jgi:hypothetical protein
MGDRAKSVTAKEEEEELIPMQTMNGLYSCVYGLITRPISSRK